MTAENLLEKPLNGELLTFDEGLYLYTNTPLPLLMAAADRMRRVLHPSSEVTWIIDRNVNITNVCISQCRFCNFCRKPDDPDAFITTLDEYCMKIDELIAWGGNQLLLQGGMHPGLGLNWYLRLFRDLKSRYPMLRLHALSPPEIVFLAAKEKMDYLHILEALVDAGLDSLPGAGAEILCDRVRSVVSPAKATSAQWLEVMATAHRMNLPTSATMMFGHIETEAERIEHLVKIQQLQKQKPAGHYGFVSFIPWPFQDRDTVLREKKGVRSSVSADDYIRLIAISRLMLSNVRNIQPSWLTVGTATAQLCLYAGANDFGSVMIEEHVVAAAGANHSLNISGITAAIREAGFIPVKRNQKFEII